MKWRELADAIAEMTPAQREQEVRFVEPYDKDRDGHFPAVVFAANDVYVGPRDEEKLLAKAGEPILY